MCWCASKRSELLVSAIALFVLNILFTFDIRPPFFEPNSRQLDSTLDDRTFQTAFLDALEALEYMYDSQMGKAKVADMVERPVSEKKQEGIHRRCWGYSSKEATRGRKWRRNGDFQIFSAYLDQRRNAATLFLDSAASIVRIMATSYGTESLNRTYFCHFRQFSNKNNNGDYFWSGNVVKAHVRWIWQRAWDPRNEFYNSFLISCPLPAHANNVPTEVFISKNPFCINNYDYEANYTQVKATKAEEQIQESSVIGLKASEIKIAVCVKGLAFLDESSELSASARWMAEWLELQWALGASSISIYAYWVNNGMDAGEY